MENSGYLHSLYAESLLEFGEPVYLPASGGWILKRRIPQTSLYDGMGCYPIFACKNWSNLRADLEWVGSQLVSLLLVTDPFGEYTQQELSQCFQDVARPYKEHFVIDLKQCPEQFVAAHHQRNAKQALKTIRVEVCMEPIRLLDEWVALYESLIAHHNIRGIAKFSHEAFAKQLRIPGIVSFQAILNDQIVGMLLWYIHGEIAYYHLGAYSSEGYQSKASFAMFWTLLEYFAANGLQWLSLGAGAGINGNEADGLTRFKRGWATGTRTAFFCGRIFDNSKYQELVAVQNAGNTHYFPAYRAGEFA
jgi:hypothetical protein